MKVPKKILIYVTIGGLISASIERILSQTNGDFVSCLTAMVCLAIYCEITARMIKEPVTVILMPSTIPLLPGSSIYYAMFYAINVNTDMFLKYSKSTLYAGLGIGLGAVISSTAVRIVKSCRHKNS